ncbi:MAG: EAL domain-containing protein [Lactimicrobium sp.]|jgi:EAL domain-containing protein (putative c-di-GMP-specific phosphodiesterase class I)|uniref:EAL domain-containing protein n=1 Tax=Lactimicrobium sp. TaxID=2563780 RepID=UPI002F356BCD
MNDINKELPDMKGYLLSHFEQAMNEGWINIYYQPVVRSMTGMVCGAEALCRWIDPDYGMISPGDLIPVLEENGRIFDLDLYVMECVCRDFHTLIDKKAEQIIPVSINLSRRDFLHDDVVERIEKIASWYQVPRELINIEITESAFIQQSLLSSCITKFHALGYQVWMDDFGTAYSTLGALKDLDFDELKIDMSFLSTASKKARIILEDIVRMAKRIGIQTLAEGVETKEQYEFLRRIGCEKIQGFYFGRPMAGSVFDVFCHSHAMGLEPLSWKKYYDDIGRIDYQTDTTLCVVEDDGQSMRVVFINEAYENVLKKAGMKDLSAWFHIINTPDNLMHDFYRRFANEQLRKLPGVQTITFPSGNHYLQLSGYVAASYEDHDIYAMQIRYIDVDTKTEFQQNADYFENLYFICDDIAVYDLSSMTMYGVKSSLSDQPIGTGDKSISASQAVYDWIAGFVYPPDQDRAKAFLNLDTLSENVCRQISIRC